jgi:serine/threonine-protein kinase
VTVPSVTGLSLTAARAKLSALGLKSTTTPVSSSQPAGTVVDQSPAPAATLAKGSTLTLSVAKATPVAVPDVSGQQQAAATSALQAAGLTAHVVSVHSSQPQGQVTAQHPAAGAKLAKGASVRLNVSDGSGSTSTSPAATTTSPAATTTGAAAPAPAPVQPTTASVPDVTQSELQAAVQKLDAAGFLASIAYVPGTDPLGTIDAQTPTGGSSAKTRSQVTINASSGPGQKTQETVPDATGQTLEQAVSTLNGAHLRLIFLKLPVTDRAQVGKIVRQTPLAGKQAPQNAQILVYLGVLKR